MSTYADAGVDIDAGNRLVDLIKPLAKATIRAGADADLGGFGGMFDLNAVGYKDPVLVAATDGVGTKLKLAFALDTHNTIGQDLVAMCVNDLVVQGAEPLFFLDYFATGGLDIDVAESVVKGIADGCKLASCALIGGETAEMPGMYAAGHYDLAGFAVGAVERSHILPRSDLQAGDILLGLASSGIHSNGYSLVRHILEQQGVALDSDCDAVPGQSVGSALLTPTKIYVKSCLSAIRAGGVKALSHITGGGFTENLPRVLPNTLAAHIDLSSYERPALFQWLQALGSVPDDEMLKTFNCGIGMVLAVSLDSVDTVRTALEAAGESVILLGEVTTRDEVAVRYS